MIRKKQQTFAQGATKEQRFVVVSESKSSGGEPGLGWEKLCTKGRMGRLAKSAIAVTALGVEVMY